MEGEFKGKIISEFAGLKSIMYSLIAVGHEEVKKKQKKLMKMFLKTYDVKNLLFCLIKK